MASAGALGTPSHVKHIALETLAHETMKTLALYSFGIFANHSWFHFCLRNGAPIRWGRHFSAGELGVASRRRLTTAHCMY